MREIRVKYPESFQDGSEQMNVAFDPSKIPSSVCVRARRKIYSGPRVRVSIPRSAVEGMVNVGGTLRHCMSYTVTAGKGGYVVVYVHFPEGVKPKDRTLVGTLAIFSEQLADGREFLAMHVIKGSGHADHKVRVIPDPLPERYEGRAHQRHRLIGLNGWIVITKLNQIQPLGRRS